MKLPAFLLLALPALGAPTLNVTSYGCVCDGKTDDTIGFFAAMAAASTLGTATVVIPGPMLITQGWTTPAGFQGHLTVGGASQAAAIVLGANVAYALDFELQAGANQGALNVADVQDLSFLSNGFTAAAPFKIAYGIIPSSEASTGPTIRHLTIQGEGWVNGMALVNVWHARISQIYGFGSSATYDSGAGPGSGALLGFTGTCVNETISDIQGDFWAKGISVTCLTSANTFQGFQIANVNLVQCVQAISLDGSAGVSCGAFQIVNLQVDNGNVHTQSHGYALWADDVTDISISNFWAADNSAAPQLASLQGCDDVHIEHGMAATDSFAPPSCFAFTNSGGCKVENVVFGGFAHQVTLDAQCSGCIVRGCSGLGYNYITPLDLGANDLVGDTRGISTVITLKGGEPSETFYVNVEECSLGGKPAAASISDASDTFYLAKYNFDDPGNTATQIAAVVWPIGGGLTGAGNGVRLNVICGP